MTILMWILTRLFRLEEISGGPNCPTFMYRWHLLTTRWGKLYLHLFTGDDSNRELHDHPKRFYTVGLWGGYWEETPDPTRITNRCFRHYRAPWFRSFPATHVHRLSVGRHSCCWTLAFVSGPVRQWGFWLGGKWLRWDDYLKTDSGKQCA